MPSNEGSRSPEPGLRLSLGSSLLTRIVGAGCAFGLHVLLARLLGADQYGTYSYVLACLGIAVSLACVGLDLSLVRFVAAYRARAAWPELAGVWRWSRRLALSVACAVAAVALLLLGFLGRGLEESLAVTGWIACGVLPVAALLRLGEARLLGWKRIPQAHLPDGVLRPAVMTGLAALTVGVLGVPITSPVAMGLHLLAISGAAALVLGLGRRADRLPPVEARHEVRTWMRVSLPLWAEAGLRVLSNRLDVILVGALLGMVEAGIYAVAGRLAELIVFGAHASQVAARPHIAESHVRNDARAVQGAVTVAAAWATLFGGGASLLLIAARTPLLGLFGPGFVAGGAVLVILAIANLVAASTALVDSILNMTGHELMTARITAAVLALKLPLLWIAIQSWGIEGAALAAASTTILGRLWGWVYVRRRLGMDGTVLGWFRG